MGNPVKLLGFITGIVLVVLTVMGIRHLNQHQPKPTQPCTDTPCIRITQADGQRYDLNDFRFLPNHCIVFVELPGKKTRQTCGGYRLEWIGPDSQVRVQ